MKRFSAFLWVFALLLLFVRQGKALAESSTPTVPAVDIDKPAPDFTLPDVRGESHSLSSYKGKFVVLEWTNFDCPFVHKQYDSGQMQKLQGTYTSKGVIWLRICSSAEGKQGHYTADEIQKRLGEDKSKATAYLVDAEGSVGRIYGAKTTPHMFVINPEGVLIYTGAIDDKPSTNVADISRATNYVAAALDNSLAGKPVAVKTSTPYGCSVKYKDR
jgi:peroxiredoxin